MRMNWAGTKERMKSGPAECPASPLPPPHLLCFTSPPPRHKILPFHPKGTLVPDSNRRAVALERAKDTFDKHSKFNVPIYELEHLYPFLLEMPPLAPREDCDPQIWIL